MQESRFDGPTAVITGAGGDPGPGRAHVLPGNRRAVAASSAQDRSVDPRMSASGFVPTSRK